jgi:hypothetical protein
MLSQQSQLQRITSSIASCMEYVEGNNTSEVYTEFNSGGIKLLYLEPAKLPGSIAWPVSIAWPLPK